jgi:hypothetical protein
LSELKFLYYIVFFCICFILFWIKSLQVYSDLEVAFAISEDAAVYRALSQTIELLEGHTSQISQHYYGCLFHELLAFQIADRHPQQEVNMTCLLFLISRILMVILDM